MIVVINAVKDLKLFSQAEKYVLPNEQIYCALMERIQIKDSSVFCVVDQKLFKSKVVGVLCFTKGKSLTVCINEYTQEIKDALKVFLLTRKVFSVIGEAKGVEEIERLIYETKHMEADETREMYLMKFNPNLPVSLKNQEKPSISQCNNSDENELFPLQCAYSKQEVLPSWQEQNLAAERLNFAMTLKNHYIFCVMENGKIVSKVQSNAITKNFIQIGGVFTKEEARGHGYASFLVNHAANFALNQEKGCVLFVRVANESALHAYKKAGFEVVDNYKMVYYKV